MANKAHQRALTRLDHSLWLIHLTKDKHDLSTGTIQTTPAKQVLYGIVNSGVILPSMTSAITQYHPSGAACFYDVPPAFWGQLVETNPSGRKGYGIIVRKEALWSLGGRPVIYTDNPNYALWPQQERYRLVATDLSPGRIKPLDFTHEREWRVPNPLNLRATPLVGPWWWLCVALADDARELFAYNKLDFEIWVMETGRIVRRAEYGL